MNYNGCRNGESAKERSKSVLLADGHEIFRAGLQSFLNAQVPWLHVVGEAGDCGSAVESACELAPEMIILDSELPPFGGLEAIRRLTASSEGRILVLSSKSDVHLAQEVIRAGARGFVLKSASVKELSQALESVSCNEMFVGCTIADVVKENVHSSNRDIRLECAVTPREREVLQLLSDGHTTKEMAELLEISVRTVETHRLQIMNKLNLRSTAELTKYAIRHGFTYL
jgi:DNA-binding NarL/FixJ family response regulator